MTARFSSEQRKIAVKSDFTAFLVTSGGFEPSTFRLGARGVMQSSVCSDVLQYSRTRMGQGFVAIRMFFRAITYLLKIGRFYSSY